MKHSVKHILSTALLLALLPTTGCIAIPSMSGRDTMKEDLTILQQKMRISTGFQSNPDTDAWHGQRQKISLSTGDRVFDKDFGRVYDSLVLAVSTLELKVNNMERTSGYIQATGIVLPPAESKAMKRDAMRDWCMQKGFDPTILDKQPSNIGMQTSSASMDNIGDAFSKQTRGVTFQLVKMGKDQTKVKVRFSDVYYPAEIEAYYKLVWQAVDKQIFVDKNVEGAVEERK